MTQATEPARDTKERILDAAESLFASQGFAATSLRQITRHAGVNLAAVNYHFQSKDSLLLATLRRKITPINDRRLVLLDALEAQLPAVVPPLDQVLRAFLRPVFEAHLLGIRIGCFPRLMGRILTEPGGPAAQIVREALGPILERFLFAIRRAEPALSRADLAWGMLFSTGAMAHHLAGGETLDLLIGEPLDRDDHEEALQLLVAYMSAGIRALPAARRQSA